MEATVVLRACGTAKTLVAFVTGGGMQEAVAAIIGDTAMDAARLALKNIGSSRDPRREVQLAVGHLQTAHVANRKIWSQIRNGVRANATFISTCIAADKDVWVSCLMAICYAYLQEPQMVEKSLRFATEARNFRDYEEKEPFLLEASRGLFRMFTYLANPREIYLANKDDVPVFDDEEFTAFKKQLRAAISS